MLREERATSGKVYVLGKDVSQVSRWKVPHLRRQIGTVFQDFRLLPGKTVHENVAFALQVIGRPGRDIRKHRARATLDLVGLADKADRFPTSCPAASSSGSASPGHS